MFTVESKGRRHYVVGNTFPVKDALRAAGAKWDPDAKAWWLGKREAADALVASIGAAPAQSADGGAASPGSDRTAPGDEAVVAARVTYKGHAYYLAGRIERGRRSPYDDRVEPVMTRDGAKYLLHFRDGSKSFWADRAAVQVARRYDRGTTIGRLREYAEQRKAEDAGERECPVCARNCTCAQGFCSHHHDGCDRCGAER